jgi:hypothetical protein
MNFNGAENRPHGFPVWSGATTSPQIGHWSIGESNKVRPVAPGGSRPGNSTARHRVSLTVTSQSMRLPPLNIRAIPGALAIVQCRGHIRARCRRLPGKPCMKTSTMNLDDELNPCGAARMDRVSVRPASSRFRFVREERSQRRRCSRGPVSQQLLR